MVINDLPQDRPRDYEGNSIMRIANILGIADPHVLFLQRINKENSKEREGLQRQLFEAFKGMRLTPKVHNKTSDITLNADILQEELNRAKKQQEEFEKIVGLLKQDIANSQKNFDDYRKESEKNYRKLYERQLEAYHKMILGFANQPQNEGRTSFCSIM